MKKKTTYVKKNGQIVGEAVVLKKTTYVHYYDSHGSFQYETGKLPKGLKLVQS